MIAPDEPDLSQVLHEWASVFMQRSFHDFKRFMDEAGLSPSQINTLMRLYHCRATTGALGVSDIAASQDISVPAASQLVERLVQQGLLERAEASTDRRFKQVRLSTRGRALVEQGIAARLKWVEDLAASLDPAQRENLACALALLTEAARQPEAR